MTLPFEVKPVMESINCLFRKSIRRLCCIRKSAPKIGSGTSAMTNDQRNFRRNPKSTSPDCRPYVGIGVELAANNVRLELGVRSLNRRAGSKETTDPESIRYR